MNVRAVKLTTGEDLITEYSVNDGIAILTNPVQVVMMPVRDKSSQQPNFGFIPFPVTSSDKEIRLPVDRVLFDLTPSEEFYNQYNSVYGSGIITPTQGIVV